ncbi:zinc finger and SCAN domain-containing protein 12-like [Dunckerocampus dactyliophorus]|uniref:zinc finger and SCAN domain-containing protein 12-like n=1 Tax=Dunckerocampus dactyliophorus TaxID=161453 RepID=UPI0024060A98|nr:zinc finger and SCAN domain-containing protein 12-like [Dunckerocampus dactyliophorus]
MCKVQMLRALVNERLTAAVEEIFVVLERTIAEYEEELSRTKEENERQRQLLDAAFRKPQVELDRADISEGHLPPEQQDWSSRMEQEEPQPLNIKDEKGEPQPLNIKKEEEDHSISQQGEHLEGLKEFPVIAVIIKTEYDEGKGDSEEKIEVEPQSSSSTQHMTTEADGDHCGGSQADNLLAPLSDSDDTTSHSPDADDENSKADMTCHTDNKLFKCSQCDKAFNDRSNMYRHMRTHTGEKPFTCSVCGKRFSQKAYLTAHSRTHTGGKPFTCLVCCQSFSQKSSLIMHTRTHTGEKPFSCSVCGKRFNHRSTQLRHTRTHSEEKPYACSVCHKNFSQNEYLKAHKRTHTGERPHPCSVCHRHFCDRSALRKHMKRHASVNVQ